MQLRFLTLLPDAYINEGKQFYDRESLNVHTFAVLVDHTDHP